MSHNQVNGKVIIAGAGSGDPELITLKAVRYLQQADVVLTDRLVSDDIIKQHVSANAKVIYVGKQCRRGASTPQETINDLMLQYALEGKLVVRLKGGDVSVFSNILDELQVLKQAGISYEIIPGISAALGAAAYAGIPLTARNYSTAVRLLTCYKQELLSADYRRELANTNDTLVFYMSSENLDEVVDLLRENNITDDKLLAVVEQATTPNQNVYTTTFSDYDNTLRGKQFLSPTLIIIGRVVALHEDFAWIENSNNRELYFKPVANINTKTQQNNKVQQHVTRA